MQELNIVELIEKNPIVKLSNTYNNKLLTKIQENFTGFERQLFVSSFYCYLNYDKNTDFVVDLDNVWKWLGFKQKIDAKRLLEKNFTIDVDYKKSVSQLGEALSNDIKTALPIPKAVLDETKIKQNGGQNRQIIMLTIKCFKSLCLKAQTKKASEIHEYYMKMEEVLQQTIEEETDELRLQLEQKENIILEIKNTTEKEKQKLKKEKQRAVEQATIAQFPVNTECIYFGTIDNTNEANEQLIKFGHTNDLATRVTNHRKIYNNFVLVAAFRVQNKVEIENLIKTYPKIKRQIRSIEVNGKNKTEIISYDNSYFTIEKLTKYIKDIIHSKTYSIDNFNRIMKENEQLEKENQDLKETLAKYSITIENQTIEINHMKEWIENEKNKAEIIMKENETMYKHELLPENETTKKFNEYIEKFCIVRDDVEVSSKDIIGQYRLWTKAPSKEIFHALKDYLDTRFKPCRLQKQEKNQVVHGYKGVTLKEIVYKKSGTLSSCDAETFVFQVCKFSPSATILRSKLVDEYKRWKKSINKDILDEDEQHLKQYLKNCEYVLYTTIWTAEGNGQGYYGLSLKSEEYEYKKTSSTGKKIEKREINTNELLGTWDTIAKAAQHECISATKMSKMVKNKTVFSDYYYCLVK
jgi:hypothetical protein